MCIDDFLSRQYNSQLQHPDDPRPGPMIPDWFAYMQTKEFLVWR